METMNNVLPFPKPQSSEPKLRALLRRPLIVGASVSADLASPSPGKKLALRYTEPGEILTRAQGGRTGIETLAQVAEADFHGRSIVLAVDLFFWDSGLPSPHASLLALEALVSRVRRLGIPVVLGEIPELLPGFQPSRAALNRALARACREYPGGRLMPFNRLHEEVMRTGSLLVNGRRLTIRELVPDGLHLAHEAGDFLADLLKGLLLGELAG